MVAASAGVVRSQPNADTVLVDSGTSVSYSFAARPGFSHLLVKLDGQAVSANGSFIATGTHTLLAAADTAVSLSTQDSAVVVAARGMLTGSNEYAAYQTFRAKADSLTAVLGSSAANEAMRRIMAESFDPVRDAPALASVLRTVAESLSVEQAVAAAGFQARTPSLNPPNEVVFLYVNGILTPDDDYRSTRDGAAMDLVGAAGFTDATRFAVGGFYNPSTKLLSSQMLTA
ncbi:MAG: hypothetical protein NTW87_33310 [Planctomycetota bacterium]|nr:hypothetical protein [Planctomycetota bacterium]